MYETGLVIICLLPGLVFVLYVMSQKEFYIAKPSNFFVLLWFYYGFSVPIDYLTGVNVPQAWGVVDYSRPEFFHGMLEAMSMFYLVLFGYFIGGYVRARQTVGKVTVGRQSIIHPPSLSLIVFLVVIVLVANFDDVLNMSRMERNMQLNNTSYKLLKFVDLITLILCCLFIVYEKNLKKVKMVVFLSLIVGAFQGDRSSLAIPIIAYFYRIDFSVSKFKLQLFLIFGVFFLFLWKSVYSFILAYSLGKDVVFSDMLKGFSLSAIDATSSFNLLVWQIVDFDIYSLLWGYSILVLPFVIALPRFIFDFGFETLSEQYVATYLPHIAEAGGGRGFGGVAEFFLNFYIVGPLLAGIALGYLCKYFDKHKKSILGVIFLIVLFRFFRSDIASVVKTYVVMFGGVVLLWLCWSLFIKRIKL